MPDIPDAIMIFAAGLGTRMAPLTHDRPKPLIKVAGRRLLDHALDQIDGTEISNVVINTHYLADQVHAAVAGRAINVVHEKELLETGGGLKNALPQLGKGPVFTMNSDMVWSGPNVIGQLLRSWQPDKMDALLALVPIDRAIGHHGSGDFTMDQTGRLERGPGYVYTGVQIIKTQTLEDVQTQKFSLNVIWDQFLAKRTAFGMIYDGKWCDVGQPASIEIAEAMLDV